MTQATKNDQTSKNTKKVVIGAAALVGAFALQPFEILRTQMILTNKSELQGSSRIFFTLNQIHKKEGMSGFWRGASL